MGHALEIIQTDALARFYRLLVFFEKKIIIFF